MLVSYHIFGSKIDRHQDIGETIVHSCECGGKRTPQWFNRERDGLFAFVSVALNAHHNGSIARGSWPVHIRE